MQTNQSMTNRQTPAHLFWNRSAMRARSHFGKPLESRLKGIFSNYIETADAHSSLNHPIRAYHLLAKAMKSYPVKDKNGCWPEELVKSSRRIAMELANKHRYGQAIKLLARTYEFADEDAKNRLEGQAKQAKETAVNHYLGEARSWANERPTATDIIAKYINLAQSFAPERKTEIDGMFCFLEGSKHSVIVTRQEYEIMQARAEMRRGRQLRPGMH